MVNNKYDITQEYVEETIKNPDFINVGSKEYLFYLKEISGKGVLLVFVHFSEEEKPVVLCADWLFDYTQVQDETKKIILNTKDGQCHFEKDGLCYAIECYNNYPCSARKMNGSPKYYFSNKDIITNKKRKIKENKKEKSS